MSKVRCGSACPEENMRLWLRLLQVLDARSANGKLLPPFLLPSGESKPYHVNCRGDEWHEIRTPSRSIDVRWRRSEKRKKRENGDRRRRNRLSNLRNQKGMQPPINEINPHMHVSSPFHFAMTTAMSCLPGRCRHDPRRLTTSFSDSPANDYAMTSSSSPSSKSVASTIG